MGITPQIVGQVVFRQETHVSLQDGVEERVGVFVDGECFLCVRAVLGVVGD
jgi:hypothetical protein